MAHGFATFEVSGDLGLEAWAGSTRELYAEAAIGLMAQIADTRGEPPVERAEIAIEGDDPADLLVEWLNAVLLESDLRQVIWTHVHVSALTPRRIEATLQGARFDAARHEHRRQVVAVSFHEMHLSLEPGQCRCRLVLDT